MLSRWPIRYKLLLGFAMLFLIVAILSFSGFQGVYSFRELVKSISRRSMDLPLAAELTREVARLGNRLTEIRSTSDYPLRSAVDSALVRQQFRTQLLIVDQELRKYREALERGDSVELFIGDKRREWETIRAFERTLNRILVRNEDPEWVLDGIQVSLVMDDWDELSRLSNALPNDWQQRMDVFRDEVKGQYRTWIVLTWTCSISTGLMLGLLVLFFYKWVFRPLRVLIDGSRRVAAGEFSHRIQLNTHDEVAELAGAMNAMTERFQQIRDALDHQVKQRTNEVVRSEQLASVGFLAAGVAHEINNPLASIAWCAESLESRLHEIIHPHDERRVGGESEEQGEVGVLRRYLKTIQDEAFRCKGITEKLLDFSRLGDVEHQRTDLRELVTGVIDMIKHLGKYRRKNITFLGDRPLTASINPQEMKQVVLNLLTNALDSLESGGTVDVRLEQVDDQARLTVTDDGCGMSNEVLRHLFEPFFTRRRDGQGTGLGLSISYRIITDHGGNIQASSNGAGEGSVFQVTLPLHKSQQKNEKHRNQAA